MDLTEQEMQIVNYHRQTMQSGKVGKDEGGRPITVYSTGIMVQEGPNKGKFVSVPGFVELEGKRQVVKDEDLLYKLWRDDILAGKWPMYNSGQELNKRSKEIHQIMDDEEQQARKSMSATKTLLMQQNPGTEALK